MQKKWVPTLLLGVFIVFLVGCNSSLFKSLTGTTSQSQLEEINSLLDGASSPGDYTAIKNKALAIIADPGASANDKDKARLLLSEAILGENGITSLDFLASIATASANNIFNIIPTANPSLIRDAAITANAAIVANGGTVTPNVNQELARAIANTVVAVSIINDSMTISSTGNVTPSGSARTVVSNLTGVNGFTTFSNQAATAYTNSGVLDGAQQGNISKVQDASSELTLLNTALTSGGTYTTSDGIPHLVGPGTLDSEIEIYLDDIFSHLQ